MDSFYDAPRRPPVPVPRETLAAVPVVPEISVLCASNGPRNAFTPYNQWKQHSFAPKQYFGANKENHNAFVQNPENSSILKKQVRFESPVLQQTLPEGRKPEFGRSFRNYYNTNHSNDPHTERGQKPTFDQIYMANIPSKQLDFSVIDLPKREPPNNIKSQADNSDNDEVLHQQSSIAPMKEEMVPQSYKQFLEMKKNANKVVLNDSVTDIFNYKVNAADKYCFSQKIKPTAVMEASGKSSDGHSKSRDLPKYDTATIQTSFSGKSKTFANKNDVPMRADNYFQSVSHAVSQRTLNKPLEAPETFKIQHNFDRKQTPNDEFQSQPVTNSENISGTLGDYLNDYPALKERNNEMMHLKNKEIQDFLVGDNRVNLEKQHDKVSGENFEATKRKFVPNSNSQSDCVCCKEAESKALKLKSEDDFSTKDLLKIIAQQSQQIVEQNNQLLMLQKQVSELVFMQNNCGRKPIEPVSNCHCCHHEKHHPNHYSKKAIENRDEGNPKRAVEHQPDKCLTSTQNEKCAEQKFFGTPNKNKNHMPNFSIGLTTSFEVSFRRPTHGNQNDFLQKDTNIQEYQPEPPRIEEITESESTTTDQNNLKKIQSRMNSDHNKETLVDPSMIFKEPIRVRETCPSPEPSIKIDMNDFDDSDSDEDSSEMEASFYRNLMTQVNKILQKAQIETAEEMGNDMKNPSLNNRTIHKVKEATLKHLQRIGVDLPNFENSTNTSSSGELNAKSYNQDEISFAVKQLLMKYLPADHLAKLAFKEKPCDEQVFTPKEKIGAIKNRPEFSFASVQYMKKYNLIANSRKDFQQPQRQNATQSPKILDISKLKQQPKLL